MELLNDTLRSPTTAAAAGVTGAGHGGAGGAPLEGLDERPGVGGDGGAGRGAATGALGAVCGSRWGEWMRSWLEGCDDGGGENVKGKPVSWEGGLVKVGELLT